MTSPKKKTKKVKAWAVIDRDIWRKDKMIFGKMFSPVLGNFSEAIWAEGFKDHAEEYAARIAKGTNPLVVPCTITYEI